MKLNEFIKCMYDINVEITNIIDEKTIYCGSIKALKKNLNIIKDYDVVAVYSSCEENCNIQIYVVEEK